MLLGALSFTRTSIMRNFRNYAAVVCPSFFYTRSRLLSRDSSKFITVTNIYVLLDKNLQTVFKNQGKLRQRSYPEFLIIDVIVDEIVHKNISVTKLDMRI